jgi:CRISPR/Cas system CMR-associated protein Cmr5 small subunit
MQVLHNTVSIPWYGIIIEGNSAEIDFNDCSDATAWGIRIDGDYNTLIGNIGTIQDNGIGNSILYILAKTGNIDANTTKQGIKTKTGTVDSRVGVVSLYGGPIRIKNNTTEYQLAEQDVTSTGPRIRYSLGGVTKEVPLVTITDPYASPAHVKTSVGIRALKWAAIFGKLLQGTMDAVLWLWEPPSAWSRWWWSTIVAGLITIINQYWWSSVMPLTQSWLGSEYWWSSILAEVVPGYNQYWWDSVSAQQQKVKIEYWWSSIAAV